MSVVIDENGNQQTWTAVYWRHMARCTEECSSLESALRFLSYGEDEGTLSANSVLGPDGKVLIPKDEIFNAVYGYGRWAEETRAQTIREIGGAS